MAAPLPPVEVVDLKMLWGVVALAVAPSVLRGLVDVFKWSLGRNLNREDEDKKRLEGKLDELKKDFVELEKKVSSYSSFEGQLKQLDTRIAEQGKALRQELKEGLLEVTVELNRKLNQTLNAELQHIVREELTRSKRSR